MTARIIQGPWPTNILGFAPSPDERAGQYLPPEQACLVIVCPYHDDYGPWPSRHPLSQDYRPILQLNLPYPDMPTLGQIARDGSLRPFEPRRPFWPHLPLAVCRYLYGYAESDFFHIPTDRLLQDPDWYENLE